MSEQELLDALNLSNAKAIEWAGKWKELKTENAQLEIQNERLQDIERLASVFHDAWACWADTILEEEDFISLERTRRWKKYLIPYDMLPDEVKEMDREWARKALIIEDES
jgi:hypothetical protein